MTRRDTRTMDLLTWEPPQVAAGYGVEVAGRGPLENRIARLISQALRDAQDERGYSRETVAGLMTLELHRMAPPRVVDFMVDVAAEIERAAMLHPGPNPNLAALTEEVGEVAQALLEARQSMMRFGRAMPEDWEIIRTEAVQVAAMAFRIVFEGDPSLDVVPE